MSNKVYVTGLGFVTRKGYTKESVWDSLSKDGLPEDPKCSFEPERPISLRRRLLGLSSCAEIGVNAAELAWKDCFAEEPSIDRNNWGVYCGTAFGGYPQAEQMQCDTLMKQGIPAMLPGVFNNTGYHLTPDIIAIDHKLHGSNNTFVSGRLASGMALLQAYDDIRFGDAEGIIAVGTDTIDPLLIQAHEIFGVQDAAMLSSGACSLVLQGSSEPSSVGSRILGRILSVQVAGNPGRPGVYNKGISDSIAEAASQALKAAALSPHEVDVLVSGESAFPLEEKCYEKAYSRIFEGSEYESRIFRYKKALGDTMGANPILGVGVALLFLEKQSLPGGNEPVKKEISNVLVIASDPCGSGWALVLSNR